MNIFMNMSKIRNRFKECTYNVGFIEKTVENVLVQGINKGDIVWLKHNYRDRFFADPFLIKEDQEHLYILCEEYIFRNRIGRIVLLTVKRNGYKLINREILIKEKHHLSFPYCELNGSWIVPEACWSEKSYAYQIDIDTMKINKKIQIADEGLVDNIFYKANDETIWLYAGTTKCANAELFAYKFDGEKRFIKILQEPVEKGLEFSRSAGAFFECAGKLYRPVQDCRERYGKYVNIMEVLSIGEYGYKVRKYCKLESTENPIYNETMHTFNVYKDIILVDGSKDFFCFPRGAFYKYVCNKICSYIKFK